MKFKEWLNEQQSTWKVIGYHRTNAAGIDFQAGFRKGQNGDFGPGVYLFVNPSTVEKPIVVEKYGQNVIKAYCDLHGFLIFDKPTAMSLYGTDSLGDQLKIILGLKILPPRLAKGISEYESNQNYSVERQPGWDVRGVQAVPHMLGVEKSGYDKNHQRWTYGQKFLHPESLMRNLNLIDKIKGFYFYADTPTTRDFVIVSYWENNVTPIAFANAPEGVTLKEARWTKLDAKVNLRSKLNQSTPSELGKPELPPPLQKPFKRGDIVSDKLGEEFIVLSTSDDGTQTYLKRKDGSSTSTNHENLTLVRQTPQQSAPQQSFKRGDLVQDCRSPRGKYTVTNISPDGNYVYLRSPDGHNTETHRTNIVLAQP